MPPSPSLLKGMANASNTPAIVACTPDFNMQYHIIIPPTRYSGKKYTFFFPAINRMRNISMAAPK